MTQLFQQVWQSHKYMRDMRFTTEYFWDILNIYLLSIQCVYVCYLSGMKLNGLAALQHNSHGSIS